MAKQKMAIIDFLPVCSNCHQVLWGQQIKVEVEDVPVQFDVYEARYKAKHLYPARCPYCMAEFTAAAIPEDLPFYCEPLWPISVGE